MVIFLPWIHCLILGNKAIDARIRWIVSTQSGMVTAIQGANSSSAGHYLHPGIAALLSTYARYGATP